MCRYVRWALVFYNGDAAVSSLEKPVLATLVPRCARPRQLPSSFPGPFRLRSDLTEVKSKLRSLSPSILLDRKTSRSFIKSQDKLAVFPAPFRLELLQFQTSLNVPLTSSPRGPESPPSIPHLSSKFPYGINSAKLRQSKL